MVFHLREVIYTIIFFILAIILIALILIMFLPKNNSHPTSSAQTDKYIPGVYSATLSVSYQPLELIVTVDKDRINEIKLLQLDETIAVMSPLIAPTIEDLESQILKNQTLEQIEFAPEHEYTYQLLLEGIKKALEKATLPETGN